MGTNLVKLLLNDLKFITKHKSNKVSIVKCTKSALSPSFICTFIYRLAHFFYCIKFPLVPRFLWWLNFLLFKVDVDHRAKLYSSLYFPHPVGIVIGHEVYALNGSLKIMQGVTIGGNLGKRENIDNYGYIQQPILLGRIFIGINSILVGPIVIGDEVFIASASIVSKSAEQKLIYSVNNYHEIKNEHQKELL